LKISKIKHMHWYVCRSQLGHLIWDGGSSNYIIYYNTSASLFIWFLCQFSISISPYYYSTKIIFRTFHLWTSQKT